MSYVAGCPCAYHLDCLGLKKLPDSKMKWYCPHHNCFKCHRKASAVGFTFRCENCFIAYCEDCCPPPSNSSSSSFSSKNKTCQIIGECKRFTALGFRWPSNACYIRCSKECMEFDGESNQYGMTGADQEETADEEEQDDGRDSRSFQRSSPGQKKEDHRRKKIVDDKESKKKKKKISSSSVSHSNRSSFSSLSSFVAPSPLVMKAKDFESLEFCALKDIKYRLFRDNSLVNSRFSNLLEIPHFLSRFEQCSSHIKHAFIHVIQYIYHQNKLITSQQSKGDNGSKEEWEENTALFNDELEAILLNPSSKDVEKGKTDQEKEGFHHNYLELFERFSGSYVQSSNYVKLKLFTSVISVLSGIDKHIIPKIGQILGLVEFTFGKSKFRFK
jgi:hypothetical protein